MSYTIEPASPADVEAIMRIESDPAYQGLVGHWSREQHLEEMARSASRYIVLRGADGAVAGFALVQRLDDPSHRTHLKRIAVREPGHGAGSTLLQGVLRWLYGNTDTNRIDLDVFLGNDRARRAYEKAGFQLEGVLRDNHRNADGSFSSQWLMSILRRDWDEAKKL